eukprot:scaffold206489_cov28-Tisochrysis_lutea.AAC.8
MRASDEISSGESSWRKPSDSKSSEHHSRPFSLTAWEASSDAEFATDSSGARSNCTAHQHRSRAPIAPLLLSNCDC